MLHIIWSIIVGFIIGLIARAIMPGAQGMGIIMTAFAFILGCVPLWFATGAGGVSRQILGTVVIGGMLAATLIAVSRRPNLSFLFMCSLLFSRNQTPEGAYQMGEV